jgi:hypothetical protein
MFSPRRPLREESESLIAQSQSDVAERAQTYLDASGRPVDAAWLRQMRGRATEEDVRAALASYQNGDGGFGQALEPDIAAPNSNPFAARIAMLLLLATKTAADAPISRRLAGWLDAAQGASGDWPFAQGVYQHPLAPWYAAWEFPSLNPALCLAGAATRLGIGSATMHQRVRDLADRLAKPEEIATASFYEILPLVEYFPWVDHPNREAFLVPLAAKIEADAGAGKYEDADHFFTHLGPASGDLAQRVSREVIDVQLDRLLAAQEVDGGWPSPYSPIWRSWTTATAVAVLRDFGRL